MKKIKLLIAAVAMVGLVSSSIASADGFAPGEGLYLGGFGGVGSGMVQPKVTVTKDAEYTSGGSTVGEGGTFEAKEGGLGLEGFEGGGWIGYGYKMGGLYAGLEGEYAAGDVEFKLTSTSNVRASTDSAAVTEVTAKKEWTGGAFGRLGFYVNDNTLLSFRGGVLVSKFAVTWGAASEDFYAGGPSFGADLASAITAIDPNLSVRVGAVYTDFLTSPVSGIGTILNSRGGTSAGGSDSEVTGSALSARIGLQYSFFDVNSLF